MSNPANTQIDIICIPFHDLKLAQSEGFRTRDTHLYRHFSNSNKINRTIIINRPTLLAELILGRKKKLPCGKVIYKKNGIYITHVEKNLYCIDVLDISIFRPLLLGKSFIPNLYNKNSKKILTALEELGAKNYITYESSPLTYRFCKTLKPQKKIFDGVDNLCKHSTYRKLHEKLKLAYTNIINSYEIIYFNSQDSIHYFSAEAIKKVEFLSNGVDFERFRKKGPEPELFKNLKKPLIVYAGKMQELLDIELIIDASKNFPDCTFVLLGKVLKKDIKERLSLYKNIIFGGDIHYEDLPRYITNATVCFIPYRVENQHGGDPIKFYEYMAANNL